MSTLAAIAVRALAVLRHLPRFLWTYRDTIWYYLWHEEAPDGR